MKACWSTLVVCWLACTLTGVDNEMFTAVIDMKRMFRAEHDVARLIKSYVQKQNGHLAALSRLAREYERHSAEAMENPEKYLSNPVIAFLMVKRFTIDWENILQTFLNVDHTEDFFNTLSEKTGDTFPDNEDLDGAADALLRLQDLYQLTTDQIASGQLHSDILHPVPMRLADCIDLGRITYNKGDYYHTVMWMQHALQQLQREKQNISEENYNRTHALILDYLAFATYQQGGTAEALRLNEQLLTLEPDNERAAQNSEWYKKTMEENQQQQQQQQEQQDEEANSAGVTEFVNTKNEQISSDFDNYERLCRGEQTRRRSTRSLTCQYRRHKPLFYIQPAREEVLNHKPRILLYHNAFSDSTIERIKELATPRLRRATVQTGGQLVTATYRVSKSAWLRDEEDAAVRRISELSGALSNLTLDTVELLQVVNYGIGGHYEPHYDHSVKKSDRDMADDYDGNRIATFICYLTDVEAGGVTAFNLAGARVVPEKGACAVWYNLLKNGESDDSTRHAACPVLVGSKWVMNKWFHERGQEFNRRCSLSESE